MNIPEDAIKETAKALMAYGWGPAKWDQSPEAFRSEYRGLARAALEAAAPLLMAQAWNEGAKAMMRAVSEEQSVSFIAPYNPYRP